MVNALHLVAGKRYVGLCSPLFKFRAPDPMHRIVQGAYFDGTTYYVAMVARDREGFESTRITLLDVYGELLSASEPLALDHANNLTFNPHKNALIASHCQSPDGHCARYSAVDLKTMTVTESADLAAPFFSMAYSPERRGYVSGEWAGQTLDYWNEDFEIVKKVDVETPKSLSQGVFADGDYAYFVRSSQNGASAEIRVYDWEGNLCFLIPLEIEDHIEPESINIVDGTAYILCNLFPKKDFAGIAYRVELQEQI